MTTRLFILSFLALFASKHLLAQSDVISGEIYDSRTHDPIPYATIEVFKNSVFVDGASSDSLGRFKFIIASPWSVIRVGFIGYERLEISAIEHQNQDVLSIGLKQDIGLMSEVIITEQRSITEVKIDKKVVNLKSDIQNAGVTVLEALGQITEIDVDIPSTEYH